MQLLVETQDRGAVPLPLTDSERAVFHMIFALSSDRAGKEVLVGLTRSESEQLIKFRSNFLP
jgi:hypothetical protein